MDRYLTRGEVRLEQSLAAPERHPPVLRDPVAVGVGAQVGDVCEDARAVAQRHRELSGVLELRRLGETRVPGPGEGDLLEAQPRHPGQRVERVDADVVDRAAVFAGFEV